MAVKNGAAHIQSLRDGRSIYLDGHRIEDHTAHRAFSNAVKSAAALYDYQAAPENLDKMTFRSPATNNPVDACGNCQRRILNSCSVAKRSRLGRS